MVEHKFPIQPVLPLVDFECFPRVYLFDSFLQLVEASQRAKFRAYTMKLSTQILFVLLGTGAVAASPTKCRGKQTLCPSGVGCVNF